MKGARVRQKRRGLPSSPIRRYRPGKSNFRHWLDLPGGWEPPEARPRSSFSLRVSVHRERKKNASRAFMVIRALSPRGRVGYITQRDCIKLPRASPYTPRNSGGRRRSGVLIKSNRGPPSVGVDLPWTNDSCQLHAGGSLFDGGTILPVGGAEIFRTYETS